MSTSHHDHEGGALPPPRLEEVTPGVYAFVQPDGSWWINNTGFLTGAGGGVAVDTCSTERRTRAHLHALRSLSDRPVPAPGNTHHPRDPTPGHHLLPPAALLRPPPRR